MAMAMVVVGTAMAAVTRRGMETGTAMAIRMETATRTGMETEMGMGTVEVDMAMGIMDDSRENVSGREKGPYGPQVADVLV